MTTINQPAAPVLDQKRISEFQTSIPQIVEQARGIIINDNEDYLASGAMLDRVLERMKFIQDFFEEPAKQANAVHKFITSFRATLLQPLEIAEKRLKDIRKDFRAEEDRKRLQKEEEERKLAKKQEDEKALQQAAQLHQMGEPQAADEIVERAAAAPAPTVFVPSTVPKEQGKSIRKVFRYRITNEDLIKREFMMPDESKIQAIVGKLGNDAVSIIGGIEVFPDEIETVRRKT